MELNIVDLIEKNPITSLSTTHNGRLLNKIKESFTNYEQQLFITSFFCYLKYNKNTDFIIDLDKVWGWLGFTRKHSVIIVLEKNFTLDIDYINLAAEVNVAKKHGGSNSRKIMMTIKTFKLLCLKTGTSKADDIHKYYMKLEEVVNETIEEESIELKQQLENTTSLLLNKTNQLNTQKAESQKEKEKILLDQFPKNTQCVYYGSIDNKSITGETLIKFGNSNNLAERVDTHKKTYTNFQLLNVFKVGNKLQIENAMKQHAVLKNKRRSIIINDENFTELLAIDKLKIEEIDDMIKKIIKETEYNIENYERVIEENKQLQKKIQELKDENEKLYQEITVLQSNVVEFTPTNEEKRLKKTVLVNSSNNGFLLYAFKCKEHRFKCGICRPANLENTTKIYKDIDPAGEMSLTIKVANAFIEKVSSFLLKDRLTKLGNDTYDGNIQDIKLIFEISATIEKMILNEKISLADILDKLKNKTVIENTIVLDPEVPEVRKAKRPIDQINKETGQVIASYPSIESAGKALGLTTGTAIGIALRNKTICKGFIWRYAGISHDDQYSDQPVIKICCSTGEKTHFNNMADAARDKDANISAPALRQRILTHVHINDHHWIFDKNSTHYK